MLVRTCQTCGAELKAEILGGLCPSCALQKAVAQEMHPPETVPSAPMETQQLRSPTPDALAALNEKADRVPSAQTLAASSAR